MFLFMWVFWSVDGFLITNHHTCHSLSNRQCNKPKFLLFSANALIWNLLCKQRDDKFSADFLLQFLWIWSHKQLIYCLTLNVFIHRFCWLLCSLLKHRPIVDGSSYWFLINILNCLTSFQILIGCATKWHGL